MLRRHCCWKRPALGLAVVVSEGANDHGGFVGEGRSRKLMRVVSRDFVTGVECRVVGSEHIDVGW